LYLYEHNYLIKLTDIIFYFLFFFFKKKKAEIYLKEDVLAKFIFGNLKYHEGDYKHLEGNPKYQIHCYDLALNYYNAASRILDSIMKEEYISNIENFDIRFIDYVFLIVTTTVILLFC
jgi:hypothetical protein